MAADPPPAAIDRPPGPDGDGCGTGRGDGCGTGHEDEARARAFVAAQTVLASPPLVPELRLHLATEVTPLWEATEADLNRTSLPPPYWAFCWVGGQALARHILDHPETVAGRRVLDFAAGSGLCGLAAGRAGAARVEAGEIDPFARAALTLNAQVNGLALTVREGDLIGCLDRAWDVVLAGDVCYERPMTDRVIPWLRALAGRGTRVLIADPGRAYLPTSGLAALARYDVPASRELERHEVCQTTVYALLPQG